MISIERDEIIMEGLDPCECLIGHFWTALNMLFGIPKNKPTGTAGNKMTCDKTIMPGIYKGTNPKNIP